MDIRRRRRHRRLEMESKDQLSHSKRDVADGGRRRLLRRHGRKFLCTRHSKRRQIVGPKPWGRNRRRRDHVFGQWETKDRRCKRPDRDSVANRNHNRQGINTWIRVIPAVVISPCFYKIFRFKRGLYSDSSGIFRGAKQSAIPLFSGGQRHAVARTTSEAWKCISSLFSGCRRVRTCPLPNDDKFRLPAQYWSPAVDHDGLGSSSMSVLVGLPKTCRNEVISSLRPPPRMLCTTVQAPASVSRCRGRRFGAFASSPPARSQA